MARKFVINVPVADLRSESKQLPSNDFSHNDLRLSQLLFNEKVELLEEKGEWMKIAALEQLCFNETIGWHPYPGWVHRSELVEVAAFSPSTHVVVDVDELPYGTYLSSKAPGSKSLEQLPNRARIVEEATLFLDSPYLWGGRGFYVDCSALINLLYRAQGMPIPRDAHAQFLKSRQTDHLQPGDPLYLSKDHKINHVLLKLDAVSFIEAPETGKNVRILKWGEDFWEKAGKIHFRDRSNIYSPLPRTFLDS